MRLDRALHARGLARSRSHAQSLIAAGAVRVDGAVATKPAMDVGDEPIEVAGSDNYVSRAAGKLLGALDRFAPDGLSPAGRRCLDAGASTGGFTQVLLERGAAGVLAVDVGHGQISPVVAADPRVDVREGVNVRDFTPETEADRVELLTADLSFISLTLVIPALAAWLAPGADALLMAKPQFEVGREKLGAGGVVRSPADREWAVLEVADACLGAQLEVYDVARSRVSGPSGNVEFFVWCGKPWQAEQQVSAPGPVRRALDRERLVSAVRREVKGAE